MNTFSIRDLFWLVLTIALCLGWFAEHRRQAEQLRREARWQQWHFQVLADVLKQQTGAKATVEDDGVKIDFPNGSAVVYARRPE